MGGQAHTSRWRGDDDAALCEQFHQRTIMQHIDSKNARTVLAWKQQRQITVAVKTREHRITSYNVCYTKLLRAAWVARRVEQLRDETDYEGVAVLYRTNAQSRQFEEIFRRERIPFQVVGAVQFYERRVV